MLKELGVYSLLFDMKILFIYIDILLKKRKKYVSLLLSGWNITSSRL